jgi:hypothetical protein
VAPGVDISAPYPGGGYVRVSGTSASSPHVAGAAAHLIGQKETAVREVIRQSAEDLGETGVDYYFGYGLVDIMSALGLDIEDEESLTDSVTDEDTDVPLVQFTRPVNDQVLRTDRLMVVVNARDNVGVEKIELYVNRIRLYSSSRSPLTYNLSLTEGGTHILEARAYDAAGNVGTELLQVHRELDISSTINTFPGQSPERVNQRQSNTDGSALTESVDGSQPSPGRNIQSERADKELPKVQGNAQGKNVEIKGAAVDFYRELFAMILSILLGR